MRRLAVLGQALAVVAHDRDDRRRTKAERIDAIEQTADHRVVEGDFAVVRPIGKGFAERRRRIVRVVGIVQVDPHEQRRAERGVRRQPVGGGGDGPIPAALERHAIVVLVESARQTVALIEHERADERGRAVTSASKCGRQRRQAIAQTEVPVVPDAVHEGIHAREQRHVRRQRDRRRRNGMFEHDALRGESIEIGRARLAIAVRAEMIGARRVERDQEDVRRRRRGRPAAGRAHRQDDRERFTDRWASSAPATRRSADSRAGACR